MHLLQSTHHFLRLAVALQRDRGRASVLGHRSSACGVRWSVHAVEDRTRTHKGFSSVVLLFKISFWCSSKKVDVCWCDCMVKREMLRSRNRRFVCALVCRCVGEPVCWCAGVLVRRSGYRAQVEGGNGIASNNDLAGNGNFASRNNFDNNWLPVKMPVSDPVSPGSPSPNLNHRTQE